MTKTSPYRYVFACCGDEKYIVLLHAAIRKLSAKTKHEILVVTDPRKNAVPINHPNTLEIDTPEGFSAHQAAIYLKTGLHKFVQAGALNCYLDTDIHPVTDAVDEIYDHFSGPVTFAGDHTVPDATIDDFSRYALNCACERPCAHLRDAIGEATEKIVPPDWLHWNGGVFLFDDSANDFLDRWHALTLEKFGDPYWKTRDQGTLAQTVFEFGLQDQPRLPRAYNFIIPSLKGSLVVDPGGEMGFREETSRHDPVLAHVLSHPRIASPDFFFDGEIRDVIRISQVRKTAREAGRIRIAHLINPFPAASGSEFDTAQQITYASMRRAQEQVADRCFVDLLSAQFPEDNHAVPLGFHRCPDLPRSVLDLGDFPNSKRLPMLSDLIQTLYDNSEAEYLIFTNNDIALQPHFYEKVLAFFDQDYDAFIINRRRIPGHYDAPDQMEAMYAEPGKKHPGFDCFCFRREMVPKFHLGEVCVGIPFIGILMAQNLFAYSNHFKLFEDEHLTFHVGEDVYKKRDQALWQHNRKAFWKAIDSMWPDLDSRKWPYGHRSLPVRLWKWGLHPSLPIRLALKLEGMRWRR